MPEITGDPRGKGGSLGDQTPKPRDFFESLTPEERTTAEHCQLFLEDQGNGFHGLVEGHHIQLTYSGGGYRGFIDGNSELNPDQARDLYVKFFPIANAQTRQRLSEVRENGPATGETVERLLQI
jgi:hypothetical protein